MAYVIKGRGERRNISSLPAEKRLRKSSMSVTLSHFDPSAPDAEEIKASLYAIFQDILSDGNTYPQTEEEVKNCDDFARYYMAFDVILCRRTEDGVVLGSVYIKPNFPGRSSHICNGGFMVAREFRSMGVGRLLTEHFLPAAKELGYEAVFFNLVFASNAAAIKVYKEFGFREIGVVPRAGYLKGVGLTDAIQLYYDLMAEK